MERFSVLLFRDCLIAFLVAGTLPAVALSRYPFPQHVVYAAGTLRPKRRTQAQQDDDVRAAYDHWKASYLAAAGNARDGSAIYRVTFGKSDPKRTVSEGQGFGMLIVAYMAGYDPDARVLFDGLWRFARVHPSKIDRRLMAWQVPEGSGGEDSAFDGDCDIAFALLVADRQWDSRGTVDYRREARQIIAAILASTIGPASRLPLLGDWVDPKDKKYTQYTARTSDFMLDHFRAFARVTANPVWNEVITRCQAAVSSLQSHAGAVTGLLPDFIVPISASDHTPKPAPARFLEGSKDGHYAYNACRDPWRLGVDALLNGDSVSRAQVSKLSHWAQAATGGVPANIRSGYLLDGTPESKSNYFSTAFASPLGLAAMTSLSQQQWLDAVYAAVYAKRMNYFEDSITLLCLLAMTGNYWDPSRPPRNL